MCVCVCVNLVIVIVKQLAHYLSWYAHIWNPQPHQFPLKYYLNSFGPFQGLLVRLVCRRRRLEVSTRLISVFSPHRISSKNKDRVFAGHERANRHREDSLCWRHEHTHDKAHYFQIYTGPKKRDVILSRISLKTHRSDSCKKRLMIFHLKKVYREWCFHSD